jgi:hypothetical protein
MHSYSAYGLCIKSEIPLPELVPSDKPAGDVAIRIGKLDHFPAKPIQKNGCWCHVTLKEIFFYWEQVGKFSVRNGKEITVDPWPVVEHKIIRLLLLGTVLGALLQQRKSVVLHAGAVGLNGSSIAFLGDKGTGKSSMVAAFIAKGYHILADDLVAIQSGGKGKLITFPAFPQLKLWPDTLSFMGDDLEKWHRLHPDVEKRVRLIDDVFQTAPVLLKGIYVLKEGATLEIQSIPRREAFIELLRHLYFAKYLKVPDFISTYFDKVAFITKNISVHRLIRPKSLSLLPEAVELVHEHNLQLYEENMRPCGASSGHLA